MSGSTSVSASALKRNDLDEARFSELRPGVNITVHIFVRQRHAVPKTAAHSQMRQVAGFCLPPHTPIRSHFGGNARQRLTYVETHAMAVDEAKVPGVDNRGLIPTQTSHSPSAYEQCMLSESEGSVVSFAHRKIELVFPLESAEPWTEGLVVSPDDRGLLLPPEQSKADLMLLTHLVQSQ